MNPSLTRDEMELVTDPQIHIIKKIIIEKVYTLFGNLSEKYKEELINKIPDMNFINPKISRGENYHGQPYVILDFPREFGKEDIFAIRSFFWWGNYFSITLHLAGRYQQRYAPAVQNAINHNLFTGWHISASQYQWEHHFEMHNHLDESKQFETNIEELPFLKLSKKIPLAKWDETYSFFIENFRMLAKMLETHAPIL